MPVLFHFLDQQLIVVFIATFASAAQDYVLLAVRERMRFWWPKYPLPLLIHILSFTTKLKLFYDFGWEEERSEL